MNYTIKIICAYCKKVMGEKKSQHPGDTHSVCPACLAEQERLLAILIAEGEETDAQQEILKAN